jgi:hypothetical protein
MYSGFKPTKNSIRSDYPLTNDEILAVCPSVGAAEAHIDRSERYQCIPTVNVLDALRKEGFQPFFAVQTEPRKEGRFNFARHMLRLRHADTIAAQESNEIILINSADGSGSFQLCAGIFRAVCQNGLVAGDIVGDVRVRHSGNVIDSVIEGSYQVLDDFERVDGSMNEMKALTLSYEEQLAFGRSAMALKYESQEETPISAHQLIQPKRHSDTGRDLWSTFNVVQESLIRGGLRGRTKENKRTTTRAVNGISESAKLNKSLWTLAEAMKGLKQEARYA